MLDQVKNFFIDTLVSKLKAQGYNIDTETVNNALANAPHIMQQIKAILASDSADRMQKVVDLLNEASGSTDATTTTTSGTKTKTKGKTTTKTG